MNLSKRREREENLLGASGWDMAPTAWGSIWAEIKVGRARQQASTIELQFGLLEFLAPAKQKSNLAAISGS